MKKNVKAFLYERYKDVIIDDGCPIMECKALDCWPDIDLCVETHYNIYPGMKRYHGSKSPIKFKCTNKFMKSLEKYCTDNSLRLKLIHTLSCIVYGIPCGGLCDTAIKERANLWHFYVTYSLRVFYRKRKDYIVLEELCPHKKQSYYRDR